MNKIKKLKFKPEYKYEQCGETVVRIVKTGNLLNPKPMDIAKKINELVDIINSMNTTIKCKDFPTRATLDIEKDFLPHSVKFTTTELTIAYRYKEALEKAMGYLSRCLMCDEFEKFDLEIKNILKGGE